MGLFEKKHSIGKTIAELRKAKGWTQFELAEKLQVSDKAISKWEKDGGAPSVEFFPLIAELFDVSIDYLMTGKKVNPQIITMSKIELCAKNDDVSLAKEINLQTKDENGKNLIDYIVQYKSYKVFAAICDEDRFITLQGSNDRNVKKFDIPTLIEFALKTNKVSVLDRNFIININYSVKNIKECLHIDDKDVPGNNAKYACLITDSILDLIVQDKQVTEKTISYLLDKQKGHDCVWYLVLPYLLHQSYLHNNNKLFNKVLAVAIENNTYAYEKWPIVVDRWYGPNYNTGYFTVFNKGSETNYFGVVRVLEKTIKLALERSDIETVEQLNELNNAVMQYNRGFKCYIASEDEIRIAKLKMDKSIPEKEIKIQSTIHNGVVNIDELLNINDFKAIKKVLEEYPIHIVEILEKWLNKSKWKEIYRFAIDDDNQSLASIVVEKEENEYIRRKIQEYFGKDKYNFNKKHFFVYENGRKKHFERPNKEQFDIIKQRVIDELALKIDKDATTGDLTKEYFESELDKDNIDMVIIKLCVRLESILRCDYHYEGDFVEMLNKYCGQFNTRDDEGSDYDPHTPKVLNKLRMKRNNIVHSEKNNVDLTLEELKYCIDYICKLG